jgi:hypothetical protein
MKSNRVKQADMCFMIQQIPLFNWPKANLKKKSPCWCSIMTTTNNSLSLWPFFHTWEPKIGHRITLTGHCLLGQQHHNVTQQEEQGRTKHIFWLQAPRAGRNLTHSDLWYATGFFFFFKHVEFWEAWSLFFKVAKRLSHQLQAKELFIYHDTQTMAVWLRSLEIKDEVVILRKGSGAFNDQEEGTDVTDVNSPQELNNTYP